MIAIIDYGMGNLASVRNALLKLGYDARISSSRQELLSAEKVILPGVGAFADAAENLRNTGMTDAIYKLIERGTPLLGVCLGLQLLFSESWEHGCHRGLDIIKGQVVKFDLPRDYKVPHMGWNEVNPVPASRLFKGIPAGSHFYFVHSYYVLPDNDQVSSAKCEYGIEFTCAVEKDNIYATQFHPEKSGDLGLKVLENFARL